MIYLKKISHTFAATFLNPIFRPFLKMTNVFFLLLFRRHGCKHNPNAGGKSQILPLEDDRKIIFCHIYSIVVQKGFFGKETVA